MEGWGKTTNLIFLISFSWEISPWERGSWRQLASLVLISFRTIFLYHLHQLYFIALVEEIKKTLLLPVLEDWIFVCNSPPILIPIKQFLDWLCLLRILYSFLYSFSPLFHSVFDYIAMAQQNDRRKRLYKVWKGNNVSSFVSFFSFPLLYWYVSSMIIEFACCFFLLVLVA